MLDNNVYHQLRLQQKRFANGSFFHANRIDWFQISYDTPVITGTAILRLFTTGQHGEGVPISGETTQKFISVTTQYFLRRTYFR